MISFSTTYTPTKTFFRYQYVYIPQDIIKTWNASDYHLILQDYFLRIDSKVLETIDPLDREVLESILEEDVVIRMTHPNHKSDRYFRAFLPINLVAAFKKLFIITKTAHSPSAMLPKSGKRLVWI